MSSSIDSLNHTDRVLHSLAQLIAQTAMQVLSPQPDDSQANLDWLSDRHWLAGRPFDLNGQVVRFVIDTNAFDLQFLDQSGNVMASFSPENRTPSEVQAWWSGQMNAWGLSNTQPLNYQLAQAPVDPKTPYDRPESLSIWAHWRTTAMIQLQALIEWSGLDSEVKIWPHHFDTGIYYSIPDETGQERAAIWAGYSIADDLCDEPYFYLSGYRNGQPINFSDAAVLPSGKWVVTTDWQGAMLPISTVYVPEAITLFLQSSYRWLDSLIH